MEILFIQLSDDPYDWFCAPGSHLLWASLCLKQRLSSVHLSRVSRELCRRFLEASWDTVLLDLVSVCSVSSCDSRQTDDDQITSQKSHSLQLMAKWMFPTDTLQQKIEITDFKPFLAAEDTSVVIILAPLYVVLICDPQHVLVSFGDVVVASVPVNLCDAQTHTVNVTVFGNSSLLEVDGQLTQVEMMENIDALDLTSSYSTFIGGIPGDVSHQSYICLILVSHHLHQSHFCLTSLTPVSLQSHITYTSLTSVSRHLHQSHFSLILISQPSHLSLTSVSHHLHQSHIHLTLVSFSDLLQSHISLTSVSHQSHISLTSVSH